MTIARLRDRLNHYLTYHRQSCRPLSVLKEFHQMTKLTEWLSAMPQVSECRDIVITIRGTRYVGAAYRDSVFGDALRYYLLGELPACYKRSTKTVFVIDGADWYIACYVPADRITADVANYHPCGASFMLCRCPSGDSIDRYNYHRGEHHPYNRVNCTIE